MFLKINVVTKESQYSIKIKFILLIHFQDEHILGQFPNHPFPSKPGTAREFINHPDHTNTTNYLQITLPLFPQYTLNQSDPKPEPRPFIDEHVLIPTLHWTAYYNFTKPLTLPPYNTTKDIERNQDELFRLTTALTPRLFTYVRYKKIPKNIHCTPS